MTEPCVEPVECLNIEEPRSRNSSPHSGSSSITDVREKPSDLPTHEIKVLVIGATNSGKTSLVESFLKSTKSLSKLNGTSPSPTRKSPSPSPSLDKAVNPTLCLDVTRAALTTEYQGVKQRLVFHFYDMAGMLKFQKHGSEYYSNVFAVLFVFDMSCRLSLDFTIDWIKSFSLFCQEFNEQSQNNSQIFPEERILICNKCDMPSDQKIMSQTELAHLAESAGLTGLFECSAKSGKNVAAVFEYIAESFLSSPFFQS